MTYCTGSPVGWGRMRSLEVLLFSFDNHISSPLHTRDSDTAKYLAKNLRVAEYRTAVAVYGTNPDR